MGTNVSGSGLKVGNETHKEHTVSLSATVETAGIGGVDTNSSNGGGGEAGGATLFAGFGKASCFVDAHLHRLNFYEIHSVHCKTSMKGTHAVNHGHGWPTFSAALRLPGNVGHSPRLDDLQCGLVVALRPRRPSHTATTGRSFSPCCTDNLARPSGVRPARPQAE